MPRKAPVKTVQPTPLIPTPSDKELDARLRESVPDVIAPGYDAYMMRIAGKSWEDIAKLIGSANGSAAQRLVSRYLQDSAKAQSAAMQQEVLQLQLDRYETLLAAYWPAATQGVVTTTDTGERVLKLDEKAALVVLRVMERIDSVNRLTTGEVSVSKETLVVSADPAEYIKQLQEVVESRTAKRS